MPRKALDEQAKAKDAGSAGSRESLSRPAPLTSEGDSLLPSGRRGRAEIQGVGFSQCRDRVLVSPGGRTFSVNCEAESRVINSETPGFLGV